MTAGLSKEILVYSGLNMTTVQSDSPAIEQFRRPGGGSVPSLPAWVGEAMERVGAGTGRTYRRTIDGIDVSVSDAGGLALSSVTIDGALRLTSDELRKAVARAYAAIFVAGEELPACNLVRMWSFIPGIQAPRGNGLNTYHVFNQGRFDTFAAKLGGDGAFPARLPTATGIGHEGFCLVIHSLTSISPGIHIENPRQVPAYRYSARYGPSPPCFARGTIVPVLGSRRLLVGGTASVRHEVSMHTDDLMAQLAETFENLGALLSASRTIGSSGVRVSASHSLSSFVHVRAYYSRPGCERTLLQEIKRRIGAETKIELVAAHLCREELLVEIEGVAELEDNG